MPSELPEERAHPWLHSFVTTRYERFGALVFNPYLGAREEMDPVEAFIVSLCNGRNSVRQIEETCRSRFGLAPGQVASRCTKTFSKLRRISAVAVADNDEGPRPSIPDSPRFRENGPALSAPITVLWDVTYACNLRCPHCLTSSGRARRNELCTGDALALIDRLAEARILNLSLSGGEPFLRPDILELLRKLASTNIRVDIASNGVGLSEMLLRSLRDLPVFQVQISIDGIGAQHDRFRGMSGAFDSSCRTARRLREDGIATSFSTTVTPENIDSLDAIIDLALKLGCSGFKAIPFIPAGRGRIHAGRLTLTPQQHRRMCQTLVDRARQLTGRLAIVTDITYACLLERPAGPTTDNGPMGCSAGYDTLSVGADGTAYPCPFLHMFPLGNLLEVTLAEIWSSHPVLETLRSIEKSNMGAPCRTCPYAPTHCRGGCRAAAYLKHGSLLAADPTCFIDLLKHPAESQMLTGCERGAGNRFAQSRTAAFRNKASACS